MEKTKILICCSELGAGKRGASLGPDAIRISAVNNFYNLFDQIPSDEIKVRKLNKFSPDNKSAKYIKSIADTHEKICKAMQDNLSLGYKMLIFSGDHSNAAGFIAGLRETFPKEKIGVIWIDAHGDLHSPYTSPSGNVHGMPLGIALGLDNLEMKIREPKPDVVKYWEKIKRTGTKKITPKINQSDIVFIDIRDLEKQEWDLINKLKIKNFTPENRKKIGIEKIAQQTVEYFKDYDKVYVSFDVDSLDPTISKGTGTPVHDGLSLDDAKTLLSILTQMKNFHCLEITEVNPLLDSENKMANAVVDILQSSLKNFLQ
jgi:arginase